MSRFSSSLVSLEKYLNRIVESWIYSAATKISSKFFCSYCDWIEDFFKSRQVQQKQQPFNNVNPFENCSFFQVQQNQQPFNSANPFDGITLARIVWGHDEALRLFANKLAFFHPRPTWLYRKHCFMFSDGLDSFSGLCKIFEIGPSSTDWNLQSCQ